MADVQALLDIMARLRDPERGCPWDVKQDFASIAPYTVEEAYEVADAVQRGDMADLRDELGDLLLQVVFHARMAEEAGHFAFADVVDAISEKMLRRHPHVFGDATVADADAQTLAWEEHKRAERQARGDTDTSALAGIARGLPEWQRAVKLQKRAATVGFDWPGPAPVIAKLHEEIEEVRVEFDAVAAGDGAARERLEDELGDVLFVVANLTRHGKVDFGAALRRANQKFERRFRRMEALAAAEGTPLAGQSLDAQDAYWNRAKAEEKAG
ncbi:MAG: nucleoside triphosphate pyrophosphohydrolase [Arenimonas sp.]|uniref:nucleoside triphosphate pyrophosphohydrolase n=1 Tax=Arenimonas sp. TaxID=1872635 RepID=UPI0025C73187|nr:nucleoside triphosphate pyrophosphohydrolase [Arenimonas sp.]MBW8367715.1 nucleoside triphosphate pyrophosphohydrolase [Arenimonas sp.]